MPVLLLTAFLLVGYPSSVKCATIRRLISLGHKLTPSDASAAESHGRKSTIECWDNSVSIVFLNIHVDGTSRRRVACTTVDCLDGVCKPSHLYIWRHGELLGDRLAHWQLDSPVHRTWSV